MKEIFQGVYSYRGKLFTKNLVKGQKVYGEKIIRISDEEYREWKPNRSKLAAAIKKGLNELPIERNSKVLYLGVAEGTTASHIADIASSGFVVGIDISARALRKAYLLALQRENFAVLLADAAKPEQYSEKLKKIEFDFLYQDIAQRNQAEIFNKNAKLFLRKGAKAMIALKGRSITQRNVKEAFKKELAELEKEFNII
ncbi:MAG: fibrillarin-like rRNA/tRNA 2'-O-methyltransferase, partial [Candidatus Diapherotrites archaeon]|nr:fibrillarin-like rRNA/tRNA 2'-O-methyltransferase [Candidatus Diapherotrites archaeon]